MSHRALLTVVSPVLAISIATALAACSSSSDSNGNGSTGDGGVPAQPAAEAGAPVADAGSAADATDGGASADDKAAAAALEQQFWDTYHGAAYDDLPTLLAKMQALHDKDPSLADNSFFLAAGYTWRLVEADRKGAAAGQIEGDVAPKIAPLLQEAQQKGTSHQAFTAGFLSLLLVDNGLRSNDPQQIQQGDAILDQLIAQSPKLGLPFRVFTEDRNSLPSDPRFQKAVDSLWTWFDTCLGTTLDRTNPDYTPYWSKANPDDGCWSNAKAPYGLNGFFVTMGDLLVKQGKQDVAKVFYQNARYVTDHPTLSGYPTWPWSSMVDDRLNGDLSALEAQFNNPDPTQRRDLPNHPYNCTTCHGTVKTP